MKKPTVPRRPMSDEERQMLSALSGCTFPVGSPPKMFVRNLCKQFSDSTSAEGITDGQAEHLARLVVRYRRQIRPAILAIAYKEQQIRGLTNIRQQSEFMDSHERLQREGRVPAETPSLFQDGGQ